MNDNSLNMIKGSDNQLDFSLNAVSFWDTWDMYMGDLGRISTHKNSTFEVRTYDWDNDENNEWHFWHKPSGVKISWYKYPLRAARINKQISEEEFGEVLKDCLNSLPKDKKRQLRVPVEAYRVDKWW